jgi:MarR family transcriptional regulator, 2-MHQ and catechol-resistance regulon repressor
MDMATTAVPTQGGEEEQVGASAGEATDVGTAAGEGEGESGTCGVLGQIDDERLQLMGLFVRTHRKLTETLGREMEETAAIPLVFFDVLIHVAAAPDGYLTMSKLSTDISLTTGGVTRLVDRMVDAGLVERQHCPNDRRSIHVVLTPEGHAVLGRAVAAHIESIDRHLMAHLRHDERAALSAALIKILDGDS